MNQTRTNPNHRTTLVWTDTEEAKMRAIFDEYPGISARQAAIMFNQRNPHYVQNWRLYRKSLDIMHDIQVRQREIEEPSPVVPTTAATTFPEDGGELTRKYEFIVTITTIGTITAPNLEAAKRRVMNRVGDIGWNMMHIEVNPVEEQIEVRRLENETNRESSNQIS